MSVITSSILYFWPKKLLFLGRIEKFGNLIVVKDSTNSMSVPRDAKDNSKIFQRRNFAFTNFVKSLSEDKGLWCLSVQYVAWVGNQFLGREEKTYFWKDKIYFSKSRARDAMGGKLWIESLIQLFPYSLLSLYGTQLVQIRTLFTHDWESGSC